MKTITGEIIVLCPQSNGQYIMNLPDQATLDTVQSPEFMEVLNERLNHIGYAVENINIISVQNFVLDVHPISGHDHTWEEFIDMMRRAIDVKSTGRYILLKLKL